MSFPVFYITYYREDLQIVVLKDPKNAALLSIQIQRGPGAISDVDALSGPEPRSY